MQTMEALEAAGEEMERHESQKPITKSRKAAAAEEKPFALIRIAGRRDQTEPLQVMVGVNGKAYSLQRGTYVPVPEEVVGALRNAEMPYYVEEEGSDRKVFAGMQQRYPFEVVFHLTDVQYRELRAIALERKITDDDLIELRAGGR